MGNTNSQKNELIENKNNGFCIYVLKLENDKYYIGKTDKMVKERFNEHLSGYGSVWTALNKPIEIIESKENPDTFDEDKYTKIYMSKYGINNVSGGSYVTIELPEYQFKSLEQELCTSKNKCFKCHGNGHFADKCDKIKDEKTTTSIFGLEVEDESIKKVIGTTIEIIGHVIANAIDEKASNNNFNSGVCFRCGRSSHWAKDCYAKKHVNGKWLGNKK